MDHDEHDEYLHTWEAAEILHVTPKTVSRWAKDGKLPFSATLGGHRRYPASAIHELADTLSYQPEAGAEAAEELDPAGGGAFPDSLLPDEGDGPLFPPHS